jgi:hypothetical protein
MSFTILRPTEPSTANPVSGPYNRVPEITLAFWAVKVMATTVGETAADYLNTSLGLGLNGTSMVMSGLLLLALAAQFRARGYVPARYWLVVVLISVVGTLISDNLVDNLGVSLLVSTPLFAAGLVATFAAWFASERTLSAAAPSASARLVCPERRTAPRRCPGGTAGAVARAAALPHLPAGRQRTAPCLSRARGTPDPGHGDWCRRGGSTRHRVPRGLRLAVQAATRRQCAPFTPREASAP